MLDLFERRNQLMFGILARRRAGSAIAGLLLSGSIGAPVLAQPQVLRRLPLIRTLAQLR
jgi:hypothetical protein